MRLHFLPALLFTGCATDSFVALSSEQRLANKPVVTWEVVEDIDAFCKKRNARIPKDHVVLACAVPTKHYCKIYTAPTTSMAALGHEVRHCFEGDWHE